MCNLVNRNVSFESFNFPEHYISYDRVNKDVRIAKRSENVSSNWLVTPGLCGKGISFKALWKPNSYLRQRDFLTYVDLFENEPVYKLDSCFLPVEGKATGGQFSFQSVNYTEFYLRHQDYQIKLNKYEKLELYNNDSTFKALYL